MAVLLLAVVAPGTSAYVLLETTGRTGAWSISDSVSAASVTCAYEDDDLTQLTVTPPRMFSQARRARRVGWQFEVWRAKWWMKTPTGATVSTLSSSRHT